MLEYTEQVEQLDRIDKIRRRAEDKVLLGLYIWELEDDLKSGNISEDCTNYVHAELARLYKKKLKAQKQSPTSKVMMVSINTPCQDLDDLDFIQSFMVKVEKFVTRKFVYGYVYNYEFYTGTDNHLHAHILLYTANSITVSKLREGARSTFKHHVENPKSLNQVHVAAIADQKIQKKVDYLYGIKIDDKMDNVYLDDQMRKILGLEKYYTDGFDFQVL